MQDAFVIAVEQQARFVIFVFGVCVVFVFVFVFVFVSCLCLKILLFNEVILFCFDLRESLH